MEKPEVTRGTEMLPSASSRNSCTKALMPSSGRYRPEITDSSGTVRSSTRWPSTLR